MGQNISRLLDADAAMGIERWFHHDTSEDTFTIETIQNIDAIMDHNQMERNHMDERAGWKGDTHLVARIPLTVLTELTKTGQHPTQDQKAFARWLDRPENRVFRTRPGKMSR